MTLFKQINLSISTLFVVLLLIVLINDFSRAVRLQQEHLHGAAQNLVETLGTALGKIPASAEPTSLDDLLGAVAKKGRSASIEFVTADGNRLHREEAQNSVDEVPHWFRVLVPLQQATASMPVTRDGTELGHLNVSLKPGFAYSSLYRELISSLLWKLAILAAAMLALWLLLRHFMDPLERVKQHADAIHNNQFKQEEFIPPTTELQSVAGAMNLMVSRVQGIFDEQERTLSRYQQLLYRDKTTNLGNRRYLLEQLQQSMSEKSSLFNCMAIIKIVDYDQLREQLGYEACNKLLKILAELLCEKHAGHNVDRLSRFNDAEFAFLSAADEGAAIEFIEALFEDFQQRVAGNHELANVRLVAGLSNLQADDEIGQSLARIDYCLSQAIVRGPFSIEHQVATNVDLPQGKMQWRSWLESKLESREFFLVGQLAISNERIPIQRELFIRTRNDQDQVVPAAAFIPMAASLGVSLEIDKEVFRLVMSNTELDRRIPLAVNLSAAFFELAEAQEDFNRLLGECRQNGTRLCVEASHYALNQFPVMCSQISQRVRAHGHRFGIDNLDFGQSLHLLQSGQFDYVKIKASNLHEMMQGEMTASYQALRTLGDTLDILIIAVAVDSQEVYNGLRELGIENMQGNFLGEPEII
jgi:EAL domain-containing protein (putative c-di-GMP-specific phosphodiesterase class I)/GGDEF domain-containing protein